MPNFQSAFARSHASLWTSHPRLRGVPTGSSIVTSPGTTRFQCASHASLSPAFHNSTCRSTAARISSAVGADMSFSPGAVPYLVDHDGAERA